MRKRTELEMQRRRSQKIATAGLRLKYSLMYDEEFNERIPDMLAEFDKSLNEGQLKKLNIGLSDLLSGINE